MKTRTTHKETMTALRRIEGQVKGVQRMIGDEKYCIDIIIQIHAVIHALYRVGERIFEKHIDGCVRDAFMSRSAKEKKVKIDELMKVIRNLHKLG